MLDLQSAWALVSGPDAQQLKEQYMTKQVLAAIVLTAAIAINGEHFDDGDILIVGSDLDHDTAKQLVRLGRAQTSDAKRGRRAAQAVPQRAADPAQAV